MAITTNTDDLDIIAALDDEPNDTGGLTASQLKAKFDEAVNTLRDWMNTTHIPELDADNLPYIYGTATTIKEAIEAIVLGTIPDDSLTFAKIDSDDVATEAEAQAGTANDVFATPLSISRYASNLLASQAEAEAGTDNTKTMTPLRASQAITALAPTRLYEKIRDLTDASGTSISIDVSDIDMSVYSEIVLRGEMYNSDGASRLANLRINNVSTSGAYKTAATVTTSYSDDTTISQIPVAGSGSGRYLIDVPLAIHYYSATPSYSISLQPFYTSFGIGGKGYMVSDITSLSTLNLVESTGSYTLYLTNASLWGVKR